MAKQHNDEAAKPLAGKAPNADQLRDDKPEGERPNASFHVEAKPGWKGRPAKYPATQ